MIGYLISSLLILFPIAPDTAAHFGVSSTLTMTCVMATKPLIENHLARDLICGAGVLTIGGIKEAYDYNGHGVAEAGDVYADAMGIAFGIGVMHLEF